MEKKIDCRGMACPLPVVNAKKAAEELGAGDVLTVLVDNEIAVQNLTRFGEHKGFAVFIVCAFVVAHLAFVFAINQEFQCFAHYLSPLGLL